MDISWAWTYELNLIAAEGMVIYAMSMWLGREIYYIEFSFVKPVPKMLLKELLKLLESFL